jgi:adenine-specific DNA-methyltransferase
MPIEKLQPTFTFNEDRLEALKQIAPEAFADGRINWETLKEALGAYLEDESPDAEHFGLFWPGKREARRLAAQPSKGTLAPAPGEGVNEETTENVFIEGDNLEVLKILQKSYAGRIKMIYIDPPYNTGEDFIYKDDYSEPLESYLKRTRQADEEGNLLTTNKKTSGRFHSNWLNMIYPRLRLARNLLREDGVILVSIDDNEVHNLRQLMNEVFGEENIIVSLVWEKTRKNDAKLFSIGHEYMLVYAQSKATLTELQTVWREAKPGAKEIIEQYQALRVKHGTDDSTIEADLREWYRRLPDKHPSKKLSRYKQVDKYGPWRDRDISWPSADGPRYEVPHPTTKQPCKIPNNGWRFATPESMQEQIRLGLVVFREDHTEPPFRKAHLLPIPEELDDTEIISDEGEGEEEELAGLQVMPSVIYKQSQVAVRTLRNLMGKKVFDNPKDHEVIARLIRYCTSSKNGDIILDFFAGSGTTAHSVLELNKLENSNRKFIVVQIPEQTNRRDYPTIAEITKDRINRAIKKLEKGEEGKLPLEGAKLDMGFKVLRLAPSNFRAWQEYKGSDAQQLSLAFQQRTDSPLVDDFHEANVLTEIALIEGFPLSSRQMVVADFTRNRVTRITSSFHEHSLYVCLEAEIYEDTVEQVAALPPEDIFICFDSALSDRTKITLIDGRDERRVRTL